MPLETRIFICASKKIIPSPSLYLKLIRNVTISFFSIYFSNCKLFSIISLRLMIHHSIKVYRNIIFMQLGNHRLQLFLRSVFCPYRIILIELSQIKEIIRRITLILLFISLVGRRYPNSSNTNFM